MRLAQTCRTAQWIVSALLAWAATSVAGGEPPAAAPTTIAPAVRAADSENEADSILERALELERQHSWSKAMELYHDASERWPSRTVFDHRRRLCESHYRLTRRYQDQSFRNVLLRLPRANALELYSEILDRIETHYVDPVSLKPMICRGLDNMEVALRDANFLRTNGISAAPERVDWLRDSLRKRRERLAEGTFRDRAAAQTEVLAACELASKGLNLGPAPVILEFAFGACDVLDDYTSYLTPDKLEDLYAMIDGNFVGLGIELKLDTQGLRLVGVIRGGPASDAGLKAGDQITHVDGHALRGLGLDEGASKLQGTEGTAIEITVLHADGTSQSYKLVRRHVEVESVAQAKLVDKAYGVGYIQLTGFQKSSAEELDKAIAGLKRQGMGTLVLDLRGNPGGLLNVAVEIAERFLDQGVIVSTRGRAAGQSQVYRVRTRSVWSMPLIVLIDRDSASASEILAGALKENNRATVVGERSYGKGSVQSIFALRAAPAGLKLTTAKFYSPLNRPYSEQGVEPDVTVKVAAKPVAGKGKDGRGAAELTFGDPENDAVLDQALHQARKAYKAAG
ncbi:MAG: S41 family peptidase [Isosphaeraceae bacterium]|nr:S41 family peptidase [Isosphaeraceae bacterium]